MVAIKSAKKLNYASFTAAIKFKSASVIYLNTPLHLTPIIGSNLVDLLC